MKKFYLNLQQYVSKTVILFWTVLIVFMFGNSIFAQTTVNLTTPGSATWTVPCGVTSLTVEAWGGGGAGGAATIIPSGGSGGGGGGYSTYVVTVTPGQIINYTIGSGAAGGIGNGGNGATTTILALTANGGSGGGQDMGAIGTGGAATGGTTNTTGGNGIIGTTTTGEAGGNSTVAGTGGLAVISESNGNNGTAPGGGGGGGLLLSGAGPSQGGNGADGQIKITYTEPVNAPSPVTPSSAVSICSGKSTNLNATSAGNTINWYTVATGGTSIGSSTSGVNFSVSPTADTTYYAETVSPAGCVSVTRTATALVTVNPLPATPSLVTPNVPTNICNGSSINLNATSAGNQIYWYTAPTVGTNLGNVVSGANFLVTPLDNTTTTYYADARNTTTGCFGATRTATSAVTTNAPPSISVQPVITPANTICEGSGVRTISITSTATTWQWRRNGVDLTNNATFSGVTTATLTITNPATTDSGTYTVMLNGSTCGLVSGNAILTVNALPAPPFPISPNGAAVVACTTAGNTPLSATSMGNTIDWYTSPTGGTLVGSSGSGVNFLVSAPTATVYYAESRNATTGCVSSSRTATASVTSNVLPVITTQPPITLSACAGVGITNISVAATGVTSYQWRRNGSPLSNGAPYSGVATGTLTITNPPIGDNGATFDVVLNNATCPVASNIVTLTVNAIPSAPTAVTPSSAISFCSGSGSINLNATSAGNTIYWYTVPTGGTSVGSSASTVNLPLTPASTNTYYAEARNPAGCNSPTRTATATITVTQTPAPNIEFTENQDDDEYTINICGHIAAGENDIDVNSGNPSGGGPNSPNFGPATGQWQVSYDDQATWVNAPGPTSTLPQYIFDPAYTIFESVPDIYYFRLIITHNGCPGISDVIKLTVVGNPTLTPGSIAGDQSSCASFNPALITQTAAAAVGTPISGYSISYQWQSSTDNINFTNIGTPSTTATTYDPPTTITQTTYYRRYAIYGSAGGGCSEVSNTITVLVGSLAPPTVGTITQPTCTTSTGSVALSSLPATGTWTLTRSGTSPATTTGTGPTTTITGLASGTYNFTVTQSTCTSALSTNVVINAAPIVPAAPTSSLTQPTCPTPKGTITITAPAPAANVTYTLTGTTPAVAAVTQASATFANLNPGAYSLTTTNTTSGCTSSATSLSVNAIPPNPPVPTASVTVQPTCTTPTGTILVTAPAPAANVTYTVTGTSPVVAAVTQAIATFANLTPGTYSVTRTNTTTGCTSSALTNLTVNPIPANPAVPTASVTVQPTCSVTTGTIVVTAPAPAANVTYTVTGTSPVVTAVTQAGATFANLAPGDYSVTTTNTTTGCTSSAISLTVNPIPANPAAPTASVTVQPSCSVTTGTIVITAPAPAANVTYTVTGTSPVVAAVTQAVATFANLNPGTYSITTTNTTTGCTSSALTNLTVNPIPANPALPTASVTVQPTCSVTTGTIVITVPTPAANVTYTVTGTSPVVAAVTQAGDTFANLAPGDYSVTTTDTTTGCISSATNLTVNPIPANPALPTASVTVQPTCSVTTGTIVVTAPAPAANVTYTVTGTSPVVAAVTQAGATFANLTPGDYSVTTTNTTTGCTSSTISLTVNPIPANPAAPTASVTVQPSCSVTTGTIVITAPAPAANVTYTVTGTSPVVAAVTQAVATFANLNPGTYSITTTNTTTGCTSSALTNLTVNPIPANPALPTASVTVQPTCSVTTGTIVITVPTPAANVTYTVTGTSPVVAAVTQAGDTFANLAPGDYSVTTTDTTTGCISSATNLTVNPIPANPALPTASVTPQPTCTVTTGTIVITAPTPAANITYTVTGTSPVVAAVTQAGATFANLTPGDYSVTATNTTTGCISGALGLTVNTIPANPATPTASVTVQPTCSVATGTIVITVPAPAANVTYTVTGTSPVVAAVTQAGATFANLNPGTYSITTTDTTTGCISSALTGLTINTQPTLPAVPSLTAGTITCNNVAANWTTIPNVTGYRIDVARDNIFTDIIPAYNNLLLGSGTVTENVTGLASGLTFYIRLRAENSCGPSANSNIITITTGSSPTAFTTALIQPNCVTATGQITINESVVDPSDQYSFDDGVTYQASNVKGLLAAGTYKLRVKNTNGCETLASTVVLNAATVTTYTGTWSNGTPDVLKKAIFASNYTFTGDIQACSCEVDTGVTVTVNPGFSLVLENGIDILGTGSIIFENNSSLIQTNNVVNTGNITYKRNTTPVGKFDYTYWSSPVSPQTLLNVSPTTLFDKYLSWDAVAGTWKVEATSTVMGKGVGYIIRGPQGNATPAVHTASFIGVPNNGPISYSIASSGLSYLIGNPYPSALDADAFLDANPALDGTIRFWTHNTPVTNLKYNGNDYASYNRVGSTGTAATNTGVNNSIPSGKIASGQAFFATSIAAGAVTFENTMRVSPVGAILDNSQFFKGPKPKANIVLKKHRVWLNLSNVDGAFKQLLIGYVTDATNGMDRLFDGQTMNANKYVDFYSINDSKKLSIQGRALPFDIMDQVPLGFKATIEGTFSISIDQVDGVLVTLPIFLEDKLTGTIVNLKNGAYSFSTAIGTFEDRFILRYMNSSIKISDYTNVFDEINKKVLVSVKNHQIKINSFDQTIDNVTIYDLSRRKLYEKGNINSTEFNVPDFSSTNQFLMVQIRLKNGKIVTDKIVY